ncbi:N-acetylglucosamine-6-phosphate deacetylase [Humisphaera borealis]|uniref:Amidohydrolase family protein n=1 Tax=Humisphaera borealis TaxID=2807512 RepID=A0A7M2X0S6_9BACT|nr:amidohydrolase family protein [Humisphaera borealis]QOV91032.1 amidohydrolase family protein [Humisphaera borealis]
MTAEAPRDLVKRVDALHYATGHPVSIGIDGGIIRSVEPIAAPEGTRPRAPTFVGPGLVDLQVNGYLGRDFNRPPISPETIGDSVRLLWQQGVTSFYPTIITNSPDAIAQAAGDIARACEADRVTADGIAGIHLEGPFISPEDGARGAHALQYVRAPDWDLISRWQDASDGRVKIVTMSPEWPESSGFIERCVAGGITVSIGHTSATPEQIAAAVAAGARLSTHLGNGAHLMLPRHPNYLWEQLAQDELWTCVIADGFHLPDQVLKVILKVKGDKAIVVSDAVSLAGMPAGTYTQPVGGDVVLTPEGRLHLASNPRLLAGSAQMLPHHISHLIGRGLATSADAWDMASVRPASLMGRPQSAGIAVGAPADLVLFTADNGGVRIVETIKAGRRAGGPSEASINTSKITG